MRGSDMPTPLGDSLSLANSSDETDSGGVARGIGSQVEEMSMGVSVVGLLHVVL